MTTKHRPPHAVFKIREMIKLGECEEAQQATDENVEFYREKIEEQMALYIEAQVAKMRLQPSRGVLLAAADPGKRVTINPGDSLKLLMEDED